MSEKVSKKAAVVVTQEQFSQLLNHCLINLRAFVQTFPVDEGKTEGAPLTQGLNVVLGDSVPMNSEIVKVLNTYCNQVHMAANKELGVVAQCEILIGETSTLPVAEKEA